LLPAVPGEDGFHMFSFTQANYDIYDYMQRVRGEYPAANMMDIASNGGGSKWKQFQECYQTSEIQNVSYSGVGGHKHSAVVDFEGVLFEVNFNAYKDYLEKRGAQINTASGYNEVLMIYVKALAQLINSRQNSAYDGYLVHGAMRTQLLWLCETMPHVRILSSVRSFESYAISQVKSRHGDVEITDELLQEAWEHWFHKVVDMAYLSLHYPDQFSTHSSRSEVQRLQDAFASPQS